jgi:hypothetical protein
MAVAIKMLNRILTVWSRNYVTGAVCENPDLIMKGREKNSGEDWTRIVLFV